MDIQAKLTAFAMLGATWVLWLLIALSVVSFTVILERAYFFFTLRDDLPKLRTEMLALLNGGNIEGAIKRLDASKSAEARIVAAGLRVSEMGPASVEESMNAEAQNVKLALERNIAFLGTVGSNAPFAGLLGTVIGIIRSFSMLEKSGGQISSGLMSEIGEALVATAVGILVALPAVAAFNLFRRAISRTMARSDGLSREVLSVLKSEKPATRQAAE